MALGESSDKLAKAERDAEIRREIVCAIVALERNSLIANLIGVLACAGTALMLPNTTAFALPLTLRLVAITATRISFARLRRRLATKQPYETELRIASVAISSAGASWALLLLPLFGQFGTEPFSFVILGVTVVGVCLISAIIAPLKRVLTAFMGSFLFTLLLTKPAINPTVDSAIFLTVTSISLGIIAFAIGGARQSRAMAQALVENRRLGEELGDALAQAEFLSLRDPLTGLLNRRAFFDNGCDEVNLNGGEGQVLAIDLDHFKRINDRFGHATGDRVLALTGEAMRLVMHQCAPKGACAVRLGGEEFALLLPGASRAQALNAAERLRLLIADIAAELGVSNMHVSASIGVASLRPGEPVARALHAADEALYRAKNDGRNRVMAAAA